MATGNGDFRFNDNFPITFTDSHQMKIKSFYVEYLNSLSKINQNKLNNNERLSYDLIKWQPHLGQGGAFATIGQTKIAVFTVVIALGAIVDRNGKVVRCHRNSSDGDCPTIEELIKSSKKIGLNIPLRSIF